MSPRCQISMIVVLFCITLGLVSPTQAAQDSQKAKICCTTFNRKPIPFRLITGYKEISRKENCRMEAIIFYTIRKQEICATQRDKWVRRLLDLLSLKLKKLANEGQTQTKKNVTHSFNHGSGSVFSTTETIADSTEGFYE
ncbi:C-C motif chemokine 20-like [Tautogolabrus adspersus]